MPLPYLLSFWGVIALTLYWGHGWGLRGPHRFLAGVLVHYVVGLLLFFLVTWVADALAWLYTLPGLVLLHPGIRGTLRPFRILVGLSVCLLPLVCILPIAETDSVGYMLPMADGARTWDTSGIWVTDTLRAVRRHWGLAAQINLYLHWTGGSVAGVCITSLPSFLGLIHAAYLLGRILVPRARRFHHLLAGLAATSPVLAFGLFTLKDDTLFAVFGVLLTLLVRRPPARHLGLWSVLGWFGVITSKLFYPLYALFLLPFLARRDRHGLLVVGTGALALGLVLLFNSNRAFEGASGLTRSQSLVMALTGAADYELGFGPPTHAPAAATDAASTRTLGRWPVFLLYHTVAPLWALFHPTTPWWDSPLWFPVYAPLLALGCCAPLALFLLRSRARHWLIGSVLFLAGYALILSPNLNHVRYLLLPLLVLGIAGLGLLPRWFLLSTLAFQAGYLVAFLATPPVREAAAFAWQHRRVPFALEVPALNPGLTPAQRPPLAYPLLALNIGRTSGYHLVTDSSHGLIFETSFPALGPAVQAIQPKTVLVSLDFINRTTLRPDVVDHVTVQLAGHGYSLAHRLPQHLVFARPPQPKK